jgi:hypothetical protein
MDPPPLRTGARLQPGNPRWLDPFDAGDPSVGDCPHQRPVIALVEIGVGGGELGDRPVESVALAEVGGDRNAVAGPSVRARQRPPACLRVAGKAVRQDRLDVGRAFQSQSWRT